MTKTFVANVVQDVIDTALQYYGANGIGKDLPIADFYEYVREFRLVDGADEVHEHVIAREAFADVDPDELKKSDAVRGSIRDLEGPSKRSGERFSNRYDRYFRDIYSTISLNASSIISPLSWAIELYSWDP